MSFPSYSSPYDSGYRSDYQSLYGPASWQWQVWDQQGVVAGGGSSSSLDAAKAEISSLTGYAYAAVREVAADGSPGSVVFRSGTPPTTVPLDWRGTFFGKLPRWLPWGLASAVVVVGVGMFFLTRDAH